MGFKKILLKIFCDHAVMENRGVVQLWNGDSRILKQCRYCNALFVDGYKDFQPLPDMLSTIQEKNKKPLDKSK